MRKSNSVTTFFNSYEIFMNYENKKKTLYEILRKDIYIYVYDSSLFQFLFFIVFTGVLNFWDNSRLIEGIKYLLADYTTEDAATSNSSSRHYCVRTLFDREEHTGIESDTCPARNQEKDPRTSKAETSIKSNTVVVTRNSGSVHGKGSSYKKI